jgi:hypothetical protein
MTHRRHIILVEVTEWVYKTLQEHKTDLPSFSHRITIDNVSARAIGVTFLTETHPAAYRGGVYEADAVSPYPGTQLFREAMARDAEQCLEALQERLQGEHVCGAACDFGFSHEHENIERGRD